MKYQSRSHTGKNRAHNFSTRAGAHLCIQVNNFKRLSKDRIIVALQRLRKIVETTTLNGYDDTTIGDKNTECSWGLCSDSKELWPDAKDHIFPYAFLNSGRMSALYSGADCPMQIGEGKGDGGCFYRCRFFQRKYKTPTRAWVLALVDAKLADLR